MDTTFATHESKTQENIKFLANGAYLD